MPIVYQLIARQPARFAQPEPCFDAALLKERRLLSRRRVPWRGGLETAPPCERPIVIENAMNPDSAHFRHRAVGENGRIFHRNISLVVEAIGHPAAQCLRRKPAFVHGDMERMFIVVSARADRTQVFNKSFPLPKSLAHKTSIKHLILSF